MKMKNLFNVFQAQKNKSGKKVRTATPEAITRVLRPEVPSSHPTMFNADSPQTKKRVFY